MTLINALQEMKARGIESMSGRTVDELIEWATENDNTARRVLETGGGDTKWAQYHIDHDDEDFIIEMNGHYIIGTWYECSNGTRFPMVTYSNYEDETEAEKDFDEWNINRQAEEIADDMSVTRPGELPRAAWLAIATAELKAAAEAANIAFKRDFPQAI